MGGESEQASPTAITFRRVVIAAVVVGSVAFAARLLVFLPLFVHLWQTESPEILATCENVSIAPSHPESYDLDFGYMRFSAQLDHQRFSLDRDSAGNIRMIRIKYSDGVLSIMMPIILLIDDYGEATPGIADVARWRYDNQILIDKTQPKSSIEMFFMSRRAARQYLSMRDYKLIERDGARPTQYGDVNGLKFMIRPRGGTQILIWSADEEFLQTIYVDGSSPESETRIVERIISTIQLLPPKHGPEDVSILELFRRGAAHLSGGN